MIIASKSTDRAKPFENLQPIVDFIARRGNVAVEGGFRLNSDGWRCLFEIALPIDDIRAEFVLPPNVLASVEYDSIFDQSSWCVIEGPGARKQYQDPRHNIDV